MVIWIVSEVDVNFFVLLDWLGYVWGSSVVYDGQLFLQNGVVGKVDYFGEGCMCYGGQGWGSEIVLGVEVFDEGFIVFLVVYDDVKLVEIGVFDVG